MLENRAPALRGSIQAIQVTVTVAQGKARTDSGDSRQGHHQ